MGGRIPVLRRASRVCGFNNDGESAGLTTMASRSWFNDSGGRRKFAVRVEVPYQCS